MLALGGGDIRLINPVSGKFLRTIHLPTLSRRETESRPNPKAGDKKLPIAILALAWQPDGRQLAAGCLDGSVRLVPME